MLIKKPVHASLGSIKGQLFLKQNGSSKRGSSKKEGVQKESRGQKKRAEHKGEGAVKKKRRSAIILIAKRAKWAFETSKRTERES